MEPKAVKYSCVFVGKNEDIGPKTKTLCGMLVTDVKSSVYPYAFRINATCPKCRNKYSAIANMRGD